MSKIYIIGNVTEESVEIQRLLESHGYSVKSESGDDLKNLNYDDEFQILRINESNHSLSQDKCEKDDYKSIFENSTNFIIIRTLEGLILDVNPMACEMLGYSSEDLMKKNFMDLIPSKYHGYLRELKVTLESQGFVDYEIFFLRKDGSLLNAEARCTTLKYANQDAVMCIGRDISERKKIEKALKESEENYRRIVETACEGILVSDKDICITYANLEMLESLGYELEEMIGKNLDHFIFKEDLKDHYRRIEKRRKNLSERFERRLRCKDGSERWMLVSATPILDEGVFKGSFAMFTDITHNKIAEEALRNSEEKHRSVVENAAEGIVILDRIGTLVDVNKKILELTGVSRDEVIGKNIIKLVPIVGVSVKDALAEFWDVICGKKLRKPYWTFKVNGRETNLIAHSSIIKKNRKITGVSVILEDVTERLKIEDKLKESVKEKEVLLREIHHRVKNNLQIISSLLNLQSNYIKNKDDLEIFRDSQNRIKSMAVIHEQLYQTEDFTGIHVGNYIKSLTQSLFNSYNVSGSLIKLNISVQNIKFDIDTAIPLGLLINELLTNSLKHAFPCISDGQVSLTELYPKYRQDVNCLISLKLDSKNGEYILVVGDNGVGIPHNYDYKNSGTLGFRLINSLVNQLDGSIKLDRSRGTKFTIKF